MTVEDVHARAAQTLEQCIVHGATRMRTQVEVDPGIGMRGFDGVQALIAEYKWAIDIEICVFPQEGLTNYPGTDELLVEGLKRGAKVIGGAPRYDNDGAGQIGRIFELAREFDVDIDMHLDVGPSAEHMDIHLVRELTEKYRRGGRVVVGHMAKLSLLPPDKTGRAGAHASPISGIAVTVLPATDLFLMGRDQDHNVRRGVADANLLHRARRQLLAVHQQRAQSGDALWRLLADPHGQSCTPTSCRSTARRNCANASHADRSARRGCSISRTMDLRSAIRPMSS